MCITIDHRVGSIIIIFGTCTAEVGETRHTRIRTSHKKVHSLSKLDVGDLIRNGERRAVRNPVLLDHDNPRHGDVTFDAVYGCGVISCGVEATPCPAASCCCYLGLRS